MYLTLLTYDGVGDYDTRNLTYCSIKNAKECSEMVYKADQYSRKHTAWVIRKYNPENMTICMSMGDVVMTSGQYKDISSLIDEIKGFV
jgi:hypothetical protein